MQHGIPAMAWSGGNTVTMYDTPFSALIKLDYILHFPSQKLRTLFFGQHQEKVQDWKPVIHGLPVTLQMLRVKSNKSGWLRIRNDHSAHA